MFYVKSGEEVMERRDGVYREPWIRARWGEEVEGRGHVRRRRRKDGRLCCWGRWECMRVGLVRWLGEGGLGER